MYFDKVKNNERITKVNGIKIDDNSKSKNKDENKNVTKNNNTKSNHTTKSKQQLDDNTNQNEDRYVTQSGRADKPMVKFIEEIDGIQVDEQKMNDILVVGAGIGSEFTHTLELIPMNYKEAMSSPRANYWVQAVKD